MSEEAKGRIATLFIILVIASWMFVSFSGLMPGDKPRPVCHWYGLTVSPNPDGSCPSE